MIAWRNCSTTVLTLVSIHSCSIELHNRMNESKHQTQCRTNIAFNLFPKGVINDMLYIINALGIDKNLSKNLCMRPACLITLVTSIRSRQSTITYIFSEKIRPWWNPTKSQLLFYEAKFLHSDSYTFVVLRDFLISSLNKTIENHRHKSVSLL